MTKRFQSNKEGELENADLRAGSVRSGKNIDNATRQQIKAILKSPKLRRGYSPEDLARMRVIVTGTSAGDKQIAKRAAEFLFNFMHGPEQRAALLSVIKVISAYGQDSVTAKFSNAFRQMAISHLQGFTDDVEVLLTELENSPRVSPDRLRRILQAIFLIGAMSGAASRDRQRRKSVTKATDKKRELSQTRLDVITRLMSKLPAAKLKERPHRIGTLIENDVNVELAAASKARQAKKIDSLGISAISKRVAVILRRM